MLATRDSRRPTSSLALVRRAWELVPVDQYADCCVRHGLRHLGLRLRTHRLTGLLRAGACRQARPLEDLIDYYGIAAGETLTSSDGITQDLVAESSGIVTLAPQPQRRVDATGLHQYGEV